MDIGDKTGVDDSQERLTSDVDTGGKDLKNDKEKSTNESDVPEANNEPMNSHWDHTARKVVVRNIFKYIKPKALQKIRDSWVENTSIKIVKHKKAPKGNWVLLTLENENMVEPFLKTFNDAKHMNKKGGLMYASRASDNDEKSKERDRKRGRDCKQSRGRENKKTKLAPEEYIKSPEQVRNALTPFWTLSYEEQLEQKTRHMVMKCLSKIVSEVKAKFRTLQRERNRSHSCGNGKPVDPVYSWLKQPRAVEMAKILGAPKYFEYRNKSELTFGYCHQYSNEVTSEEPVINKEVIAPKNNESNDIDGMDIKVDNKENIEVEHDIPVEESNKKIIKTPAVGFMAAGWSGGVSDPHCLMNIPDAVCGIADIVNKFLIESPVPPYNSREHKGVWRTLTVRTSDRTKQCMIVVSHAPPKGGVRKRDDPVDDYSDTFDSEKERLTQMLTKGLIPRPTRNYQPLGKKSESDPKGNSSHCDIRVTSLFFQEYDGVSSPPPEHPLQHVYGIEYLEEKLLQCHFRISPGAFFQVTTEGAEILYNVIVKKVREVTENPKDTVLFDICCGTGTIGLTCMKEGAVGKVVGIDISIPAINDAIDNAESNGFSIKEGLTKFVASRAELVISEEMKKVGSLNCPIVAVVDPAREGLHQDVCRALRNERKIQRIVYVSCNPTGSLIKDAVMLCSPKTKRFTGLPFRPIFAQPVDMFPLTSHCEMVIVFDRMGEEECEGKEKEENDENVIVDKDSNTNCPDN